MKKCVYGAKLVLVLLIVVKPTAGNLKHFKLLVLVTVP